MDRRESDVSATDIATSTKVDKLPIEFTIFPSVTAQSAKRERGTWEEVVERLRNPAAYPRKEACPLIKLATFGDRRTEKGAVRHDGNVLEVFGIEADYDAEKVGMDRAADLLTAQGIEAFLYTTPSHVADRPRWRVLAPLSKPHAPAERERLVAMLNSVLGGILAAESFTLSQTYYFGKVKGVEYRSRHVRGQCLDTFDLVLDEDYGAGDKPKAEKTRDVEEATAATDGDLDREIALHSVTAETIYDLRSALSALNPERADDRTQWINVLEALASLKETPFAAGALGLAHEFSKRCPEKYDVDDLDTRWEGINPTRITHRSIFEWATADGWINPRSAEALKANATAATRLDRTDAGNVALLASLSEGNLRFVPEHKVWLWWSGERWERDQYGNFAMAAALQVAEHYHKKAADISKQAKGTALDARERKSIEKAADSMEAWANRCRNKAGIDSMLGLAKSDPRFTLPAERLDRDPWLFGVENGVVDLRTGALRPAGRDDFVTKRSPVRFNPQAQAPRWLQFIEEITGEHAPGNGCTSRPALAAYMQRALGYAMTGSTAEHKMFIAIGEGSNGKNVLLDLLQWVLGDYCETIAPEALMASRHDADAERATPSARKLAGARVAISSESKDGQRLDVALVKRHTGGGFMTARGLHENAFTFEITHKLWLMTNHRPALDHMDEAMRGRLHMIPFDMRWNRPGHPERDPKLPDGDKALPEKLKAEAEGVLAWLVAGAVAYHREELNPPPEVVRMTRAYFKDQDPIGLWLDTCEPCDHRHGAKASELFDAFCRWCDEEGYDEAAFLTQKAFSNKLKARGFETHKCKDANRYALRAPCEGIE